VAQHLLRTVQAAALMGALSIMSGVRPETAQSMVHLGIELGRLQCRNTLRDALQLALRLLRERAGAVAAALDGDGLA
jgi:rsbT co-antagonist protein RsbR